MYRISSTGCALALLGLAGLLACEGTSANDGFVARDSAGVGIAENGGANPPVSQLVGAAPEVVIGEQEGPPEYLFSRIAAAHRLADGRFAVADARQHEVRFFDPRGKFLGRVGRQGAGPGEYEAMEMSLGVGDTLLVWDFVQRRITLLDGSGRFARTIPVTFSDSLSPAGYWFVGRLQDGTLLLRSTPNGSPAAVGVRRDTVRIVRVSEDGRLLNDWGRFPGDETVQVSTGRGISGYERAFGRKPHFLPVGNGVVFGSGDSYELREYTNGQLRRIVRRQQEPVPVTGAEIQAFKERWVGSVPSEQRLRLQRIADEMPYPATLPAHGRLLSAGEGSLWVQQYAASAESPETWDRFDEQGRWAGTVVLPPGLRATQAGLDFVLGISTDSVGVERVVLYRLRGE